ncbi:MAG TPA: hypothetical protein VM939_10915 [Gemmatimonadaceae bacterium]|nr:hypothetical protein [Gemmatimonadaceae bacterium]
MRNVRIDDSPSGGDRARLRADIVYAQGGTEEYWYDVPRSRSDELSRSGNPWMACLLPLAATLGEPLVIPLPVDKALAAGCSRLNRIWKTWYPHLWQVALDIDIDETEKTSTKNKTAAFFSGGVDSFFTLLRERETAAPSERSPINDLITVWGFDISLDRRDAFARLRNKHERIAAHLEMELTDVATNIRETRWKEADWSYLAHGAGLASIALALEGRFETVYIAGGGGYRGLHPWGSHSVTDPLFSTRDTSIVYDGVAFIRTEKIELLSGMPLALDSLRVCYETWTDENCGQCNKCLRTMLGLEICDALDKCSTLPHPANLLDLIERMDSSYFADYRELEDLRRFAESKGRRDTVRAIDRTLVRGKVRRRFREGRRMLRDEMKRMVLQNIPRDP